MIGATGTSKVWEPHNVISKKGRGYGPVRSTAVSINACEKEPKGLSAIRTNAGGYECVMASADRISAGQCWASPSAGRT